MIKLHLINNQNFPSSLGNNYFYVTGSYDIQNISGGKVNYFSWVQPNGVGIGVWRIQLSEYNILFLNTKDTFDFVTKTFLHQQTIASVVGGLMESRDVIAGIVSFHQTKCYLCVHLSIERFCNPTQPANQNYFLNVNKKVYTTEIESGNPKSLFRVGLFDVEDLTTAQKIGINSYFNTQITEKSGFGLSFFILKNQIFYIIYSSYFSQNIEIPNASVSDVEFCLVAGQSYNKYLKNGYSQYQNYLPPLNLTENFKFYYYDQLFSPTETFPSISLVTSDKQTYIYESSQIQGSIRLGEYNIRETKESPDIIGKIYFQTYIFQTTGGGGQYVLEFFNRGLFFAQFNNILSDPLDPNSSYSTSVGITGGTQEFKNVDWGYIDFEPVDAQGFRQGKLVYHTLS